MIGRIDDQRVVLEALVADGLPDAADLVIDQRDHPVVVRDERAHLRIALRGRAREPLAESAQLRIAHLRHAFERGAMPPGPAVEIERAMGRQVDVVGIVQAAPRLGRIERMMRIRKRRPHAEVLVTMLAQEIDRAIADPGRVVPGDRQRRVPRLRRVGQRRQLRVVQRGAFVAAPVGVIPALVVLAARRMHRRKVIVAFEHQLDVAESHVRPVPVRAVVGAARPAFRRARGGERVRRREVRLADERRRVPLRCERRPRSRVRRLPAEGRSRCRTRRASAAGARSGSTSARAGRRDWA